MSSSGPPSDSHKANSSWAPFLSPEQNQQFDQLVLAYFKAEGIPITLDSGIVTSEQEGLGPFGLQNLAQLCAQAPADKWQAIIHAHFNNLRRGQVEATELGEQITNFERVKTHIAVRIYPQDMFAQEALAEMIYRQDLEGTLTVLVLDLPSTIRTLPRPMTSTWGKTDQELIDIGIANLGQHLDFDHEKVMMSEDLYLNAYIGEGYYVAAYSLMLEKVEKELGRYGALVGIPHRHMLLTYPIHDIQVLQAINGFLMALPKLYQEGPGSITPNLYWYNQGGYLPLPYAYHDDEIRFSPPQAFLDLIEVLKPPEETVH
ncbi:MAG: hypothetical protein PVF49_11945 [Anaerolineales bacterium]